MLYNPFMFLCYCGLFYNRLIIQLNKMHNVQVML